VSKRSISTFKIHSRPKKARTESQLTGAMLTTSTVVSTSRAMTSLLGSLPSISSVPAVGVSSEVLVPVFVTVPASSPYAMSRGVDLLFPHS
jgi:hypothetical protein